MVKRNPDLVIGKHKINSESIGMGPSFISTKIHTVLSCKHCGEEVSQYGPETFHTESTLIRCNLPGDAKWAEVTVIKVIREVKEEENE